MKKTAYALALVTLILLGAYPLLAADAAPSSVAGLESQTVVPTRQGARTFANDVSVPDTTVLAASGDFDWLQPSLVTKAYAGPTAGSPSHRLARAEKRQQQVPLTTGAWLMGLGLVAFIISRKRFNA